MKKLKWFCIFLYLFTFYTQIYGKMDKIVCYYGSWAVYRHSNGKFDVEQIDPTLCTHLVYTFIGLEEGGKIRVLDPWNDLEEDWGKGAFKRFVRLKTRNPQLKTLIAIGGWNEGSINYSQMVADDKIRGNFVNNAVDFVRKYGFDGLDLDWEYPNQRGGQPADVQNYVKLIKELRTEFDKHGLLLTAAVAAAEFSTSQSYDIPSLSKYLDFISIMIYDLHGPWEDVVGHNAPLYPSSKDITSIQRQLNVKSCVENWIRNGANPEKLVLGIATYGRTYTLKDPNNQELGAPISAPGQAGPYTSESGSMGYNEVCEFLRDGSWKVVWDDEQKVPHMIKGNQWIGYDNPESVKLKVGFAKEMGLGGCMIWSVETDDFRGISGTTFPILKTINVEMGQNVPEPTTSTETTSSTVETTTSVPPSSLCKVPNSYVRDPVDCGKFYYCLLINSEYKMFEFHCPDGLQFDLTTDVCNYPWIVKCGH